jgi:hypothetical protein
MTDIEMLIMALLAVAGAIVAAVLGWADSDAPFDARKFLSSIGRAIFAGLAVAATTLLIPSAEANVANYVLAVLAGAGIDVLGNRGAGVISLLKK